MLPYEGLAYVKPSISLWSYGHYKERWVKISSTGNLSVSIGFEGKIVKIIQPTLIEVVMLMLRTRRKLWWGCG